MHIGMQLLHPAATDHSVSISRRQVQCIFRFLLRSRAGIRPLSGGTGAVAVGGPTNWDPYQKATDTAPSSVPWRPPVPLFFGAGEGPHRKISYNCYGTTHSVGLDNTGKTYPFNLEQERCGSPYLTEGGSKAVTHMDNSQMHMEDWR